MQNVMIADEETKIKAAMLAWADDIASSVIRARYGRPARRSGYAVNRLRLEFIMAEMPKRPSDDSAQGRMDRYARDQQGLRDWTNDAIRSHAAAIGLALEFDDRRVDDNHRADEKADPLPSEKELRTELQLAGKKFDRSPAAMWQVLKKYYRESDAHLDALAERFVSGYEADLREANERRRLGQTDDDEPDPNTETQPFKTIAKEAIAEMVTDTGRCETEVVERFRQAIRNHPNIGAVSADPPGAQDGMRRLRSMARHEVRGVRAGRTVGLGANQQDATRSPCALLGLSRLISTHACISSGRPTRANVKSSERSKFRARQSPPSPQCGDQGIDALQCIRRAQRFCSRRDGQLPQLEANEAQDHPDKNNGLAED